MKKSSLQTLALPAIAVLLAASLSACGKSGGSAGADNSAAPGSAAAPGSSAEASGNAVQTAGLEVDIPIWWDPDHEIKPTQDFFDSNFTPKTGIKVKLVFVDGGSFTQKVITAAQAKKPYPVLAFNANSIPAMADKGLLEPLDPFIQRDNYSLDDFVPGDIDSMNYNGKTYGLSSDLGGYYLYYNKTLFEQAGVEPPSPDQPMTWDELLDKAQKLTDTSKDVWGLDFTDLDDIAWPRMNGQDYFDDNVTKIDLTSDKTLKAFSFAHDLIFKYKVAPPKGGKTLSAFERFQNGKIAMLLDGSWGVGQFRANDPQDDWDIAPLPIGPDTDKVKNPIFNGAWSMSSGLSPEMQDAAWQVLQFYGSEEFGDNIMGKHLSSIPSRHSVIENQSSYNLYPDKKPQNLTQQFLNNYTANAVFYNWYRYPFDNTLNTQMKTIDKVFSSADDPQKSLAAAESAINKALANMPWVKK